MYVVVIDGLGYREREVVGPFDSAADAQQFAEDVAGLVDVEGVEVVALKSVRDFYRE